MVQFASSEIKLEDGALPLSFRDDNNREQTGLSEQDLTDEEWLQLARDAWESSTDFMNSRIRRQWEESLDHFNSRHHGASKYNRPEYKDRTRHFRPKTRAAIRRAEAACAQAFFSTQDVVNISPVDDTEEVQRASADIMTALVNHRLTKQIPWFRILQGQFQTAQVMGVCCSRQYWRYEEREEERQVPVVNPMDGQPILDAETGLPLVNIETVRIKIRDELVVEPMPPENLRVHEGCDWLDPINSSPYLIGMFPIYTGEIRERIAAGEFLPIDESQLRSARIDEVGSVRTKREGYDRFTETGMGSKDSDGGTGDDELCWLYENIRRIGGRDYVYYTLYTEALLTRPRPIEEVYFHADKIRPYTWGMGLLEAFRPYPVSKAYLIRDLQKQANEISNLRLDNVKQTLHPKVLVRNGRNVDAKLLTSAAPGGVVYMNDPAGDAVFVRPPEVTQSAYEEQNYLNIDMDDLSGTFSSSSVQSNRQLNETVGGMRLLSGNANAVLEYELRTFAETWVEPTLRQIVHLIEKYETDEHVLALAGKQAGLLLKYGQNFTLDELLDQDLTVTVSVGMGSTDPAQKFQKFMTALGATMQVTEPLVKGFGPNVMKSPGYQAIMQEIWGSAGYKDGMRFVDFGDMQQQGQGGDPQAMDHMMKQQGQLSSLQAKNEALKTQMGNKAEAAKIDYAKEAMKQKGETVREGMKSTTARYQADLQAHLHHLKNMMAPPQQDISQAFRLNPPMQVGAMSSDNANLNPAGGPPNTFPGSPKLPPGGPAMPQQPPQR